MPTVVFTCGAECAALADWTSTSGTVTRDTGTKRSGAASIKFTGAANAYLLKSGLTGAATRVGLFYLRVGRAMPSSTAQILALNGPDAEGLLTLNSSGQLVAMETSGTPVNVGSVLSLDTWYRISFKYEVGTSTYTLTVSVNGGIEAVATKPTLTPGTGAYVMIGQWSSYNAGTDIFIDDLCVSGTSGDYPIPDGTTTGSAPEVWTETPTAPIWTTPADTVSMSITPDLKFTSPASAVKQHFQLQLDTANTFDTGNLRTHDSSTSQTNWTYWNGSTWVAIPSDGLPIAYAGNEVDYTVTSALSGATWYRRVRAGTLV